MAIKRAVFDRLIVEDDAEQALVQITATVRHDDGTNEDHKYVFTQQVDDPEARQELAQHLAGDGFRVQPKTPEDLDKDQALDDTLQIVQELVTALVHTVEYVGLRTLPAIPGWGWYDALAKHAPGALAALIPSPDHVIAAHQRKDAGDCICDTFGASHGDLGRSHSLHVWDMLERHGVTGPPVKRPARPNTDDQEQVPGD